MQYSKLVEIYEKLDKTTKRLEKTHIIAEFLKKARDPEVVFLLQGKVLPGWDDRKIGVASQLIIKAISKAMGSSPNEIQATWKKTGDLGIVAEQLAKNKKQRTLFTEQLTVKKILLNLRKLPDLEGTGSVDQKVGLIAELITSATPSEAKYIVKTVLEELRAGVGDMSIRDAIVWAFYGKKLHLTYDDKENNLEIPDREKYKDIVEQVQRFNDIKNDFSQVFTAAQKGRLNKVDLDVGKPLKVMLAQKVQSIEEGFQRCGTPADFEFKYDGFRMQIHKSNTIKIFTRRMENITNQFPEVVEYVKKHVKGKSFILDGEAVGFDSKTKKHLPFQNISQRIKRKYDIEQMSKKYPVELNIFDILHYNGASLLDTPFKERKKTLKKIVKPVQLKGKLAESIITDDTRKVEKFFKTSLSLGNEGLMIKNLDAPYKPGSRVGYMVKLKQDIDTLDLAVIGAEWGEGKRAKFLSSYYIACLNTDNQPQAIGKVASGIKEKEDQGGVTMKHMTDLLQPLITGEKDRHITVQPRIIIEVRYEEIQKSPKYSSGYALRFPRILKIREDKGLTDATTLREIVNLYKKQK